MTLRSILCSTAACIPLSPWNSAATVLQNALGLVAALVVSGTASVAQERVQQPSFLPANNVYYSSECAAQFTGWIDPLRAHLVIVASSMEFKGSPTAGEDINNCLQATTLWLTMAGLTDQPVRFELTDASGTVLIEQTLAFGG